MDLRYIKRVVKYGDMLKGENHLYKTVLQYTKRNLRTGEIEWLDVPCVNE
tara:strand:- start:359 stop:508 length:150 start_codon:yes stop_codon:yes gene_type:complete